MHFLIFGDFFKNGSPGQTTLPIRFVSKFCAEPQSQCLKRLHQDSFPSGKTPKIVPWTECRPEFPDDADGDDDDAPTIFLPWPSPSPNARRDKISRKGKPLTLIRQIIDFSSIESSRSWIFNHFLQFSCPKPFSFSFRDSGSPRGCAQVGVWCQPLWLRHAVACIPQCVELT